MKTIKNLNGNFKSISGHFPVTPYSEIYDNILGLYYSKAPRSHPEQINRHVQMVRSFLRKEVVERTVKVDGFKNKTFIETAVDTLSATEMVSILTGLKTTEI